MARSLLILALLLLAAQHGRQLYQAQVAANVAPPPVPTGHATRGNLLVRLAGNGTLEAEKTYLVANEQVEAQITQIVEDGVMVKKGDLLVQMDTTKIEKEISEQLVTVEQAKAQIAKVEADNQLQVSNAVTKTKKAQEEQELLGSTNRSQLDQVASELRHNQAELTQAERQRLRKKNLARDLLIPLREAELADLTVASKGLNVRQGEKKLTLQEHQEKAAQAKGELLISDARFSEQSARNKAEEQIKNARFNWESAQRRLELLQMRRKWCTVTSPATGLTVVAREWDNSGGPRALRPGDTAFPSRRFMDIIDLAGMRIVANVSEIDISRVRVGQPALIRPRSAPDTLLHGRVRSVSSLARPGDVWRRNAIPGKKTFRMVVTVTESRPELLRPGMTADYEVVEKRLEGVVTVPIQAVFRTSKGTAVFVKKGDRFRVKPVRTGQRNDNRITIAGGLKGSEVIALRRPPLELMETTARKPARQVETKRGLLGYLQHLLADARRLPLLRTGAGSAAEKGKS